MEDVGPTASFIIFAILLLVDMFFYGFGAAIISINSQEVDRKAEENKDKKSIRLAKIINDPAEYVNTLQLIVTLVNMVMGVFYLSVWVSYVKNGIVFVVENNLKEMFPISIASLGIISTIITLFILIYIILTFGVLLPKKIASRVSMKWAYACINPIYYITLVLSPLTGLVSLSVRTLLRIFGIKEDVGMDDVTEEEIISMVNEGQEQGILQASEAEMITNIFEFGDKEAQDIMVYRRKMVAIEGETPLIEAIQFMLDQKNSRFPVYEENIDHIIGILHLKDAMRLHSDKEYLDKPIKEISGLIREVKFITETRNIDELFRQMQSEKLQMVIVVDEYGQTVGLIAMEDILEEIVGNIMDEYDEDNVFIVDKGNDEYIIEGKTPLEEVEEKLEIIFDEEEFETLNGFLISKLQRIPDEEEAFDIDYAGYNFKILAVENKMIQSVLAVKLPEEVENGEAALED